MSKLMFVLGLVGVAVSMVCAWWSRNPLWLIGFAGSVVLQAFSVYMTEE